MKIVGCDLHAKQQTIAMGAHATRMGFHESNCFSYCSYGIFSRKIGPWTIHRLPLASANSPPN